MIKVVIKWLCLVLVFTAIIAGCFVVSENWIDTKFRSVSEVEIVVDENSYVFPLQGNTSIKYKTSDSSYVFVSRGNINGIKFFYENIKKYGVDESDGKIFINKDGQKYVIEKIADDLEYVMYSVAAVN